MKISKELIGIRFQMKNTLEAIYIGEPLLYKKPVEVLPEHFILDIPPGPHLESVWSKFDGIEPFKIPGTLSPQLIGKLLIDFKWIKPIQQPAFGFIKQYDLNNNGIKAFKLSKEWWNSLSFKDRMIMRVFE